LKCEQHVTLNTHTNKISSPN